MKAENAYPIKDVYIAAAVALITGYDPEVRAENNNVRFMFPNDPDVVRTVEDFQRGICMVDAKPFSIVATRLWAFLKAGKLPSRPMGSIGVPK